MAEERIQRRLAAILAADVVGYSRLVEADEAGTFTRLRSLQSELIVPMVAKDGGRVVKVMGDGVLIEFASAVDAVRNALAIQAAMRSRNSDLQQVHRIEFRMGVNVGDVIIDGDDIQGDGVNIAARLEGLCEAGQVYVSGAVYDHVEGKLDANFDDLGKQTVKNMEKALRVYRVRSEPSAIAKESGIDDAVPPSDKPSIAVLPFENMSGDPEQEYFSDGISEDIITALSRFRWFFVIARNSSFIYKSKAADVKQVAHDLGVQYVLEGSVRKSGDRVRITAQLIDALTGRHVWADRYDRDLIDVFAVQDEITEAIIGAIAPSFVSAEARRVERKPPESLDAWDYVMRGNWRLWHYGKADVAQARSLFETACALDPKNAMAHSGRAMACMMQSYFVWTDQPEEARATAYESAKQAVSLDEEDAWAYTVLGFISLARRRHGDAISSCRQALELNPNLAIAEGYLGLTHAFLGNDEDAILHADRAIRLSPRDPMRVISFQAHAHVAFRAGQYEEATQWAKRSTEVSPEFPAGWRVLATSCAHLDRLDEAKEAVRRLLLVAPHVTISSTRASQPSSPDHMKRYLDGLRKAGLPE